MVPSWIVNGSNWTALLAGVFYVMAGVALFVLDKTLSPRNSQYPCAHPLLRFLIRLHVFTTSIRGIVLLTAINTPRAHTVPWTVALNAASEFTLFSAVAWVIVSNPLSGLAWQRLLARYSRARTLFKKGRELEERHTLALEGIEGLDVAPYLFRAGATTPE